jgi:hypothetical protein
MTDGVRAEVVWPDAWQPEARAAIEPYFATDTRVEILFGNDRAGPLDVFGSMQGYTYIAADGQPMIIWDRSGRRDVHPWPLAMGPVLRIKELRPRRRALVVYQHPEWSADD